jgi:ribosomal protein S8
MDAVTILLKYLKRKSFIEDIEKSKGEVKTERIALRKEDNLFIRDAITGIGNILKEDLEQHYYITTVKMGVFGNILTYAIILRDGAEAEIAVYAREGFIKQHLADKTIQKLKVILC